MKQKMWAILVMLGMVALVVAGCGGGGVRKVEPTSGNPFPSYSGPTGSIVLHVVWPQGREIPPETTVIDIEVTGEGLQTPRRAQIQKPNTSTRIDNLPIGQKGVSATARAQVGGPALAYGFATTVVEPNKVKDVVIELKRIEQAGVAQVRALIQEIRDSIVSLGGGLVADFVDQTLVWTADIVPTFALTLQRLDFVHYVLTEEHPVKPNGELPESARLTSLPYGTYQAHLFAYEWGPWQIGLEKISDQPSDAWVVKFPENEALVSGMELTFKLTKKDNNLKANEGEFRVTSATEPQLLYEGRCMVEADTQKRVTKITVNGTFKDKFLPDGITVQGTVTGTPQENAQKSYTQVSFTGSIQSPKLTLTVGEATAIFVSPQPDHEKWGNFVTKAELKNFQFKTMKVTAPVEASGELSVEIQIDDQTADKGPLPKKGTFRGIYNSNRLSFSGTISFDWQNPQRKLSEVPKGTARISGRLAIERMPIFSATFSLISTNPPNFTVDIDLTRGEHFLKGSANGEWKVENGNLKVTKWEINLRNENDLLVKINEDANGHVVGTVFAPDGATKLADIQRDPDLELVLVRYIDGTLESLGPADAEFKPHLITGTVRGRVVDDQTGQGIPEAWVWSGYEGTSTDSQGFFEVRAYAGHQTISVYHWRYEEAKVEVDLPAHATISLPEPIRLRPLPSIFGTVRDAQTNNLIQWANVLLVEVGWTIGTDQRGKYEFIGLNPGTYTVRVTHPDYEPAEQKVTIQAGERKEVNFLLQPLGPQ
ncbi:MAG: carboxypeptidase-like regulatory domain-containing protein [Candidatus Bathyarchaeia archaeon]